VSSFDVSPAAASFALAHASSDGYRSARFQVYFGSAAGASAARAFAARAAARTSAPRAASVRIETSMGNLLH